jgi:ADP-ribose pyrophosphatase YjhB (NUDIX family)
MAITEEYTGRSGVKYIFEYHDTDSFDDLPVELCKQTYGVCFYGDKMVIGYGGQKHDWGLIGGAVEQGETLLETLAREIKEESNMKVLRSRPIGYQKVTDTRDGSMYYQLRYMCIVEPYGDFTSDPDGGITEIKLIDPADYKKYFDWGKIGESIISKAIRLKKRGDLKPFSRA